MRETDALDPDESPVASRGETIGALARTGASGGVRECTRNDLVAPSPIAATW